MLVLDRNLGLYIPATKGTKQIEPADHIARCDIIGRQLSRLFGGSTRVNDCTGLWLSNDGQLIGEHCKIVYSYCAKPDYDNGWPIVWRLASDYCHVWRQEAITILDDNSLYIYFAGENIEQLIDDKRRQDIVKAAAYDQAAGFDYPAVYINR